MHLVGLAADACRWAAPPTRFVVTQRNQHSRLATAYQMAAAGRVSAIPFAAIMRATTATFGGTVRTIGREWEAKNQSSVTR